MHPYIGVTGFTKPKEVSVALRAFPKDRSRKIMVGAVVTWKSLRALPMKPKWAKQAPDPASLGGLFLNDERAVNLAHYSTEEGQESSVLADMLKVHGLAGPNFHGFQLNLAWPHVTHLIAYRETMGWNYRVVLQLGQKAIEQAGGTPQSVANMLFRYANFINDVLFDPSGGLGKPFDTERAREFLSAIAEQGWNLGLGVAGGLSSDSLNLVEPLIAEFPKLSIDAQGRLRNAENELDIRAVRTYLAKALRLLA